MGMGKKNMFQTLVKLHEMSGWKRASASSEITVQRSSTFLWSLHWDSNGAGFWVKHLDGQLVPVFRKLQQASLKIPVFSGSFLIFCRCFSLVLVLSMIFASHNVLFLAPSECLIHSKNKSFLPEWSSFSSRCHCEVINTKSRPLTEMWGAGWDTGHPYPGWMENQCLSALRARNIGTHSTAWR